MHRHLDSLSPIFGLLKLGLNSGVTDNNQIGAQ